jgi:predicted GNAT family acetyltransferase
MTTGGPTIERNDEDERFELWIADELAELDFHLAGKRLSLIHTEVPESKEGQGIGGRLVQAALDYAAAEGLTVIPYCPFAREWLERHPDVAAQYAIEAPG